MHVHALLGTIVSGIAIYSILYQLADLAFNAAAWLLKTVLGVHSGSLFMTFTFFSADKYQANPFLELVMPYFYGNGTQDAGYNLFRFGWILFAILAAFQILKTFRDPAARGNASPGRSLVWVGISAILMIFGFKILGQFFTLFSQFMTKFASGLAGNISTLDSDTNLITGGTVLSEPTDYILTVIIASGLAATTIKACVTYVERYLSFAITAYLAPVAFACAVNDDTRDTMKRWVESMFAQALGIFLSVAFLALAINALTKGDDFFAKYNIGSTRQATTIAILKCISATVLLAFCSNSEKFINILGFQTMPNGDAARSFLTGAGMVMTAAGFGMRAMTPVKNAMDSKAADSMAKLTNQHATDAGVKGAAARLGRGINETLHPEQKAARVKAASPTVRDNNGVVAPNAKGDTSQASAIDKERKAVGAMEKNGDSGKLKDVEMSSTDMAKASFSSDALKKLDENGMHFDSTKSAEYARDENGNVYGLMHGYDAKDGREFTAYTTLKGQQPPKPGTTLTTPDGKKYVVSEGSTGFTGLAGESNGSGTSKTSSTQKPKDLLNDQSTTHGGSGGGQKDSTNSSGHTDTPPLNPEPTVNGVPPAHTSTSAQEALNGGSGQVETTGGDANAQTSGSSSSAPIPGDAATQQAVKAQSAAEAFAQNGAASAPISSNDASANQQSMETTSARNAASAAQVSANGNAQDMQSAAAIVQNGAADTSMANSNVGANAASAATAFAQNSTPAASISSDDASANQQSMETVSARNAASAAQVSANGNAQDMQSAAAIVQNGAADASMANSNVGANATSAATGFAQNSTPEAPISNGSASANVQPAAMNSSQPEIVSAPSVNTPAPTAPEISQPAAPHYASNGFNDYNAYFNADTPDVRGASAVPNMNVNADALSRSGYDVVSESDEVISMKGVSTWMDPTTRAVHDDAEVTVNYDKNNGTAYAVFPDGTQKNASVGVDDSGNLHVVYDNTKPVPGNPVMGAAQDGVLHQTADVEPANPFMRRHADQNYQEAAAYEEETQADEGAAARIRKRREKEKEDNAAESGE